jgi:hypothetical protein
MVVPIVLAAVIAIPGIAKVAFRGHRNEDQGGACLLWILSPLGAGIAFLGLFITGSPTDIAGGMVIVASVVTFGLMWWAGDEMLNMAAWTRAPLQPVFYCVLVLGWPIVTPIAIASGFRAASLQ